MKRPPTPVWLLTGYLGSGKTTLLQTWLRDPALANAVLVINEIGEVGLDDRLLANAVDSAAAITSACVCCSGLADLQTTLADLWWDRLHRRRPAFDAVVIETTGLADPAPILAAFGTDPLLEQRYRLAGVLVTVSATAGADLLASSAEARAQVSAADLVIITKTDRAAIGALGAAIDDCHPGVARVTSSKASLGWTSVTAVLDGMASGHTRGEKGQARGAAGAEAEVNGAREKGNASAGEDVRGEDSRHDAGEDHGHGHEIEHAQEHRHDHGVAHDQDRAHRHDQDVGDEQDHGHDHEHRHDHDVGDEQNHGHDHEHRHEIKHDHGHGHEHAHAHHHPETSHFVELPDPLTKAELHRRLRDLPRTSLRRAKGVVRLTDQRLWTVQWAVGDKTPELVPFEGAAPLLGLTCIVRP